MALGLLLAFTGCAPLPAPRIAPPAPAATAPAAPPPSLETRVRREA